ncbi:MAG: hypothetical protein HYT03_00845 [Candidatus Harrisonbacteria bacterium]|nr:hypothetical protein [Candidatus Harrisonbacteria bacterium]
MQKIVFGIPTLNEADNIKSLTVIIDKGLRRYFKNYETIIINADSRSKDDTKGAFLQTSTESKKVYISTAKQSDDHQGKGANLLEVFRYAKRNKARAVAFIDGDVKSASPEWVKRLIDPVLKGYDHVLPVYLRNKFDGAITNHFIFPVLYGLLLRNLRQPLAGEIAVSPKAYKAFLKNKWYPSAYKYGVDIYMVTQSIFSNCRFAETFLGIKSHKPSAPKLHNMIIEVADSLFRQLAKNRRYWQKRNLKTGATKIFHMPDLLPPPPELYFNYKKMKKEALKEYKANKKEIETMFDGAKIVSGKNFHLSSELWAQIIYEFLNKNQPLKARELAVLRALLLVRFMTFYHHVAKLSQARIEEVIIRQAKAFRHLRGYALRRRSL